MNEPTPSPSSRLTADDTNTAPAKPGKIDSSIGLEPGPEGPDHLIGRDPRTMTPDELRACGHQPKSPLKALRERCIDCCGGSLAEARYCVSSSCPCWPFRMGENPWRSPPSEAKRESGRTLAERRRLRGKERADRSPSAVDPSPATPIAAADGEDQDERPGRSSGEARTE
jgi:hypothetical protein